MTSTVAAFRALHRPGDPLVLPNVWDVGSARIAANLGAAAVATSSGGVAWAHGVPDGGLLAPDDQVALARRLTAAVSVPVTMDVEDGYSGEAEEVAAFLRELASAGVAGVNVEDSSNGEQRSAEDFASFVAAVRSALGDVDLFINARVDSYLLPTGETEAEVLARSRAYVAAGADGVFLPGLTDVDAIARLCQAISAPVNVMAGAGSPPVAELAAAGVARISTGTWLAESAYGAAEVVIASVVRGSFEPPAGQAGEYGALNAHMAARLPGGLTR